MILPLGASPKTHRSIFGLMPSPPSMVAGKPWLIGFEHSSHHLARFFVRSPFLVLIEPDRPSIRSKWARQEPSATINVAIDRRKETVARLRCNPHRSHERVEDSTLSSDWRLVALLRFTRTKTQGEGS
ncbi:hypothetical protein JCGZ_25469 [Jatropha curcas]|uniref:Uncharacterized protein n=1 Tax=Jatropha curcas TaxID=180498 RepID=A0A067LGQ8_JATCU|nr:hypothetical protein JCGZ_25469 [Jatropha curcas]